MLVIIDIEIPADSQPYFSFEIGIFIRDWCFSFEIGIFIRDWCFSFEIAAFMDSDSSLGLSGVARFWLDYIAGEIDLGMKLRKVCTKARYPISINEWKTSILNEKHRSRMKMPVSNEVCNNSNEQVPISNELHPSRINIAHLEWYCSYILNFEINGQP